MDEQSSSRRAIRRDALAIGVAAGAYAVSFGALSVASGLSVVQTQALSVLMFTGASQFAFIGVLAAGGGAAVAIGTAVLIGARNGVYSLAMAPVFDGRGWRRLIVAQLTIDESTAMASRYGADRADARQAFWATGLSIFVLWNIGTLLGALGAGLIGDPATYGLDAAIPAAFLALLWPRLDSAAMRVIAGVAALVAVALTVVLPAGTPVLVAGTAGVVVGLVLAGRSEAGDAP